MVTRRLALLATLAVLMGPCQALAQPATCYYQIGEGVGWGPNPFKIRVVWSSGHTSLLGYGDRLPVGCNVDHYEVGTTVPSCTLPTTTVSITLIPLSCPAAGTKFATALCGAVSGAPITLGAGLECGSCPSCGDTDAPDKPDWTDHPDPGGDDDGDGIPNGCDSDEVDCTDANSDGCCDRCASGGGSSCLPPGNEDWDDDGIPNKCDVDMQDCDDANSDGCCDECTEAECNGGDGPGDDDDDEDKDNDGIIDCPDDEGEIPPEPGERKNCCGEDSPDADEDGVCDDCDPTYYEGPSETECDDDNEDGVCDDCEFDEDEECDVCGKLESLIDELKKINNPTNPGHGVYDQQYSLPGNPPTWHSLPGITNWSNLMGPPTAWNMNVPIPGTEGGYTVNLTSLLLAPVQLSSLGTVLTTFRQTVRIALLGVFAYKFVFAIYKLVCDL